jgi:DnaJ-domain-containing protein 1
MKNIKYLFSEIDSDAQEGVAMKFDYNPQMINNIKKIISRYRYRYNKLTNEYGSKAGGWNPTLKTWVVAKEVWEYVEKDVLEMGYILEKMETSAEEFFEVKNYDRFLQEKEKYEKKKRRDEKSRQTRQRNKEARQQENNNQNPDDKQESKKENKEKQSKSKKNHYSNQQPKYKTYKLDTDYQVIGVSLSATWVEIKQAYRDLVEIWHPDRFTHNDRLRQKAEEQLKEINSAYDRLKQVHEKI